LMVAERVHLHPEQCDDEVEMATGFSTALFIGGLSRLAALPCRR